MEQEEYTAMLQNEIDDMKLEMEQLRDGFALLERKLDTLEQRAIIVEGDDTIVIRNRVQFIDKVLDKSEVVKIN